MAQLLSLLVELIENIASTCDLAALRKLRSAHSYINACVSANFFDRVMLPISSTEPSLVKLEGISQTSYASKVKHIALVQVNITPAQNDVWRRCSKHLKMPGRPRRHDPRASCPSCVPFNTLTEEERRVIDAELERRYYNVPRALARCALALLCMPNLRTITTIFRPVLATCEEVEVGQWDDLKMTSTAYGYPFGVACPALALPCTLSNDASVPFRMLQKVALYIEGEAQRPSPLTDSDLMALGRFLSRCPDLADLELHGWDWGNQLSDIPTALILKAMAASPLTALRRLEISDLPLETAGAFSFDHVVTLVQVSSQTLRTFSLDWAHEAGWFRRRCLSAGEPVLELVGTLLELPSLEYMWLGLSPITPGRDNDVYMMAKIQEGCCPNVREYLIQHPSHAAKQRWTLPVDLDR